jgi:nucleoside-diphosphate-sugar epimerase
VNPRDYVETNVIGSLVDACTRRAKSVPITEEHPLEAQSPHAASKIAADKLMESFHRDGYGGRVPRRRPVR